MTAAYGHLELNQKLHHKSANTTKIKFVEGEYEQTIESDCEFSNKI